MSFATPSVAHQPRFSTIGLTERDLEPVQFLVENAQEQAKTNVQAQVLFACYTWINAFTQFKHLRRKQGLPTGKAATLMYGAMLGQLKMVGKVLAVMLEKGEINPSLIPISVRNFEACVRELQCDDALLEMGLLGQEDLGHIAEIFEDSSARPVTASA